MRYCDSCEDLNDCRMKSEGIKFCAIKEQKEKQQKEVNKKIMIYDLVYCSSEPQKELKEKFPEAVFEDASDFIHKHRFSICVERRKMEYRRVILEMGLALVSLHFHMWMLEDPKECRKLVDDYIKREKLIKET